MSILQIGMCVWIPFSNTFLKRARGGWGEVKKVTKKRALLLFEYDGVKRLEWVARKHCTLTHEPRTPSLFS